MVGKVTTSFAQLSRTRRLRDQRCGTRPTSSAADNANKGHDLQQAPPGADVSNSFLNGQL